MSTDDLAGLKPGTDDRCIDERDERALQQYLTVLDDVGRARHADDLFLVVSESGKEYLVDARLGACECPDHEYRGIECKHIKRLAYATGRRPVPAGVDVDPQLGHHVSGGPVATDGGAEILDAGSESEILVAGDDAEILDEDTDERGEEGDGRPEDCTCDADDLDVACWACYREGFAFDDPADTDTEGAA